MCKMVGVMLDSQANYKLEFKYEINEKEASYDGYGFGYFLNIDKDNNNDKNKDEDKDKNKNKDNFKIFKKPLTKDDPKGKFCEKYSVNSDNLIVHIRYASSKNIDYENTHPFVQNRFMIEFNGYTPKGLGQMELLNGMKNILSYFSSSKKIKEIFEGIGNNLSKVENAYTIKYFVDEFFLLNGIDSVDKINEDFLKKFKSLLKETNKILRLNLFIMFDDCLIVYQDDSGHNRLRFIEIERIFDKKLNDKYSIMIKDQDLDFGCELNDNTKGYIFLTENIDNDVKLYRKLNEEGVAIESLQLKNSELFVLKKGDILYRM